MMSKLKKKNLLPMALVLCLFGCSNNHESYAPVVSAWEQPVSKQGVHVVAAGETLYSIAWRYGYDYRDIASFNHISEPYRINKGQKIYLVAGAAPAPVDTNINMLRRKSFKHQADTAKNLKEDGTKPTKPRSNSIVASAKPKDLSIKTWYWPTKGTVKDKYSIKGNINKGINITSKYASPVRSAASGEVVYSGNGILGYGNLIIIKHSDKYLSAYAHNRVNLVKEGTKVKAQQKIAEVGFAAKQEPMLHFEIRENGKPVDPMRLLPAA